MLISALTSLEMGTFMHPCETDMVFRSTNEKVPKFNSFVYLQNKQAVGKVDEIFGAINEMARTRSVIHLIQRRCDFPQCE